MSTQDNIPVIKDRKDVIQLSADIECPCGRLKDKAHCPACGRIKLYALADTQIAIIPNIGDVIKDCKMYRCLGCGEKFNDVDWYFNCHAPKKIDWVATKAKLKDEQKKTAQDAWMKRIVNGERFDYNDRTKCKAEAGFDPYEMRTLLLQAKQYKAKPQSLSNIVDSTEDQILNLKAYIRDHPEDNEVPDELKQLLVKAKEVLQKHVDDCTYCASHTDYCPEAQKLKDAMEKP